MAGTNVTKRGLPTPLADGAEGSNWGDRFNAQHVVPNAPFRYALAEQGCYFVGTSPTPQTGIATKDTCTEFAETAGSVGVAVLITNTETAQANTSKRIYLDYIAIRSITAVPTSATIWMAVGVLDYSTVRFTSGGSAITPKNVNGDSSLASVGTLYFGDVTTAVPATRRLLFNRVLRDQIPVAGDQYILAFGQEQGGSWVTGAGIMSRIMGVPPVVIGPAQNFALHMFGASAAGPPQWEFEMGWWEK